MAGGDTLTIIYLKLLLLTIKDEGIFQFESLEPTVEEEISFKLQEDLIHVKTLFAFMKL